MWSKFACLRALKSDLNQKKKFLAWKLYESKGKMKMNLDFKNFNISSSIYYSELRNYIKLFHFQFIAEKEQFIKNISLAAYYKS